MKLKTGLTAHLFCSKNISNRSRKCIVVVLDIPEKLAD